MTRNIRQYGLITLTLSLMLAGAAFADGGEVTNAAPAPGTPGAAGAPGTPVMASTGMSSSNVNAAGATDSSSGTDSATPATDSGTGLKNTGGEPLIVSMLGMLALGSGLALRRKLA